MCIKKSKGYKAPAPIKFPLQQRGKRQYRITKRRRATVPARLRSKPEARGPNGVSLKGTVDNAKLKINA